MDQDPLQYVKDIQNISWKNLGYSDQMTRQFGNNQSNSNFMGGDDMDAYFEDGGFQGAKIQSFSANKIITSVLQAAINVGGGSPKNYLLVDGVNQRFLIVVNNIPQTVIGEA